MKILLMLFACLNVTYGASTSMIVDKLGKTEFDAMFTLEGPHRFDKVVLDCQSFVHGINFWDHKENREPKWERTFYFYLDFHECSDIYLKIRDRSKKKEPTCLTLYSDQRYSLSHDVKNCR